MTDGDWLAERTARAPGRLRQRMAELVPAGAGANAPGRLAEGALRTLEATVAHAGARASALDLLAADGLITLALLAQAETEPAALEAFARALVRQSAGA